MIGHSLLTCNVCQTFLPLRAIRSPGRGPLQLRRESHKDSHTDGDGFYVIRCRMGFGSFGHVYEAAFFDESGGVQPKVALKVMEYDESVADEVYAHMCCSTHPNVVELYESFAFRQNLVLAMEFCEGSVRDIFLQNYRRAIVSESLILLICRDVLRALTFMHDNLIVHRDLKAANILCDASELRFKIGDFGVTHCSVRNHPATNVVGTIKWFSPEMACWLKQFQQKNLAPTTPSRPVAAQAVSNPVNSNIQQSKDKIAQNYNHNLVNSTLAPMNNNSSKLDYYKCDLYALGICLYEMATSRAPFDHLTNEQALELMNEGNFRTPTLPSHTYQINSHDNIQNFVSHSHTSKKNNNKNELKVSDEALFAARAPYLDGNPSYGGDGTPLIDSSINKTFRHEIHDFSPEFRSFINRLLERDPEKRPHAFELLDDPFLNRKANEYIHAYEAEKKWGEQRLKYLEETAKVRKLQPDEEEEIEDLISGGVWSHAVRLEAKLCNAAFIYPLTPRARAIGHDRADGLAIHLEEGNGEIDSTVTTIIQKKQEYEQQTVQNMQSMTITQTGV